MSARFFGVGRVRAAAAVASVIIGAPSLARAQVQDDAALADVPDERPPPRPQQPTRPPMRWSSGSNDSTRGAKASKAEEQEVVPTPMTMAELRAAYPDLQFRVTPPPTITLGLTSIYPLQAVGIGLGTDVYLSSWLRLSSMLSLGGSLLVDNQLHFSYYADAGIGVVALRSATEVVTEIKALQTPIGRNFRSKRSNWDRFLFGEESPPPGSYVRAIVPAFHLLEVEGGLFSGLYPLYRCTAKCTEDSGSRTKEDASVQLNLIYIGLRYVYFRWARSQSVPFVTRFGFEAAVEAITNPFWSDDATRFNLRDTHPTRHPVGARVRLRLMGAKCGPNGGCVGLDLMGGYLPTPDDGLFSVNLVIQ